MKARRLYGLLFGLVAVFAATAAQAHFIWVAIAGQKEGAKVQVFFGEAAEPDSAEFLDRLTRLKVWHRNAKGEYVVVETKKVVTDDGGMLASKLPKGTQCVEADCLFGIFARGDISMRLQYYAKSLKSDAPQALRKSKKLIFDIVPQVKQGMLQLQVLYKGKPVEGSQVIVAPPTGEAKELKTNDKGVAALQVAKGRYEIRARRIDKQPGELEKKKYDESRFYCTLTLHVGASAVTTSKATSENKKTAREFTDLPRGITSFGATVVGDWLYVYGGHFGRAHHYSNTSQSDELSRLNLKKLGEWEVVSTGPRLQGLAMVSCGGKIYRIGGFTAHNAEDDEHDLRSVADFERFDPETKKWEKLPSLPEPRSSHDAVVIGDKIYVAGGWQLGENQRWHDTAWAVDLSQPKLEWEALPKPPFQRRALSLGHLDGKLYVIGGMQRRGGPTTRVDTYDPASRKWIPAPSLIDPLAKGERGQGMEGFGSSADTVGGRLYVSTYGGNLQVLGRDAKTWHTAKKLLDDRFFHRMLQFDNQLFLVGGASMRAGKRLHFENVDLSSLGNIKR